MRPARGRGKETRKVRNGGIRNETRSSALWGKGGRGAVTALAAMLVLSVPFAASAPKHGRLAIKVTPKQTWISPGLVKSARQHPNQYVRVIIQSSNGNINSALSASTQINQFAHDDRAGVNRRLSLVDGVATTVRLRDVARLSTLPNLIVTPDVQVHVSAYSSNQLWPYETGVSKAWSGPDAPKAGTVPAIAIVDSGVETGRKDFGNRIVANVKFSTLPNDSSGDGRGHGTFVAGIAAGGADNYTGATPQAPIVSLDVMNDNGLARTSDVIAAAQWILANKDRYNIRVANFSLHSGTKSHFFQDPLDQAVEKLWFNNVVVVAAAGNYGYPDKPSGVLYAPGNDPFVITVGAVDIGGTKNVHDDLNAPWSAYGRTPDGFMKPELAAPGRYMVGPVPEGSTLAVERADQVVAKGYIQLSGTSFAAPVISGAAAQILAKHPEFTPDQVKGALMASTKDVAGAAQGSVGVGELQMSRAAMVLTPPNPNKALEQWVKKNALTGDTSFDAVSWLDVAKANVSWDSVSWDSVSWADAAWNVVSWADVSWADVSWADVSWADVSWADTSYEDAAEGDTTGDPAGYELTPEQAAEIMADPETAPDPSALPPAIAAAVTDDPPAASATG